MYFYELHEGDDDLFADLVLVRETEMEPDVFFDIVQTIRHSVQGSYRHNTLIEAIAEELERDYEFLAVTDDRLVAAINVSKRDDENFLAELGPLEDDADSDEDSESVDDELAEDEEGPLDAEFRSLYLDIDPNGDDKPH